jgi:lysophospholipase L1-like esterase
MRTRRIWAVLGSLALLVGVAGPVQSVTPPPPLAVPSQMDALGDSITIAYDIKRLLSADPTYSWSTGTQSAVSSIYSRLEPKEPDTITRNNRAVSGARIGDLLGQAAKVSDGTAAGEELVTILMGANDACTRTEDDMTSLADFRARAAAGLDELADSGIDQVVVASIPDLKRLLDVGKSSSTARFVWSVYGICQSMLARPTSTQQADIDRRERVQQRVKDFNAILGEECARIVNSTATACTYDGGAVFNTQFVLNDISKVDYFHPSAAGQAKLAAAVFTAAGFPK